MRKVLILFLGILYLLPLNSWAAADCPINLQIIDSLKKKFCIDKFSIGNIIPNGHSKKLTELIKNSSCFSLAISTETKCTTIGASITHSLTRLLSS